VVTGLGAKAIDEAISGLPRSKNQQSYKNPPLRESVIENPALMTVSPDGQDAYYAANANNLDLPAFLRRTR
jgi:hypothetical protein